MSRVEWKRLSGDEVEAVVGMFVCSRFPNAVRVRPSQGDGGIDVFVPGSAGWAKERAVWQIKRYSENLNGTEKRAIKRSFSRVLETSENEGWEITEWHLVMPLDLTSQNLGWLDTIVADAGFPCETNGLLWCDTQAANYQKVVDYYLRDGKDRLQAEMNNLTAILSGRLDRKDDEPLMPADVLVDLAAIHKALNACDPFYKYNYAVTDNPPPDDPSPDEEGLIAAYAIFQNSVWITFKIYALTLASLEERPITWRLQLAVPADDSALKAQVEKFIDYGAPLTMPAGTVSGSLDLPAGLGGDLTGASLQVTNVMDRPVDDEETELAIAMLAPDTDTVVASTTIRRTELSTGQGGVRSMWVDEANLFTIEMLARKEDIGRELTWNFHTEYDLNGRRPAEIVNSLKFLAAMHAPNRMGIGMTYGPKKFDAAGPPPTTDRDRTANRWALVADALDQLQDHVTTRLLMPAAMTGDQSVAVIDAAKLVSGQAEPGNMTGGTFSITHDVPPEIDREYDKSYEFVGIKPIKFTLDDKQICAGKYALFFRGRYADIQDDTSTIEPESDCVSIRYDGELDVNRLLARNLQGVIDTNEAEEPEPEPPPTQA